MGAPAIPSTPQNASVNRVRIVDLPGLDIDKDVRGEQAYHLLSAPAIARYALERAEALALPVHYRTGDPDRFELRRDCPLYVNACLQNSNPTIRNAAEDIARQLGRNLGYILLTLHRGDRVNRAVRPDWTAREWARWHKIRQVHIGGGIAKGLLGDRLMQAARALIAEAGYGEALNVTKSPQPRSMPVMGSSRYLPEKARNALCLDIGQTSIKAVIAHCDEGSVTRFTGLPTRNVLWPWRNAPEAAESIDPEEILQSVTQEILKMLEAAERIKIGLDPDIMVSIAAYVRGGKLLGNGIYARMRLLGEDTRVLLAHSIRAAGGCNTIIHLIHDGTAAAALHAGEKDAVVLVLGTAIGVGFVPESTAALRPIRPDVQVQPASG